MTAPGPPPVPARETVRKGHWRGPAAHDRLSRLPRIRSAAPAARPPARHRGGLPGAAPARGAGDGRGSRSSRSPTRTRRAGSGSSTGDITAAGLGLSPVEREAPRRGAPRCGTSRPSTTSPWPATVARRVNVDGTAHVLDVLPRAAARCAGCSTSAPATSAAATRASSPRTPSTVGQEFRNHYEETKYEAELLVRKAMADGMPATIYRPGIVVGDSATGATQKYDGPYFLATFLAPAAAGRRGPGGRRRRPGEGVPRAPRLRRRRDGRALGARRVAWAAPTPSIDPDPPTVREVVDDLRPPPRQARGRGCRCRCGPVHALVEHVPGMERLLGPAGGGARLLRLADDVRDGQHDTPTSTASGLELPAASTTTPAACSTSCRRTPSTTPTR